MAGKPLGPGPGAYRMPTCVGFPNHDPSRERAPAYSLGARLYGTGRGQAGPGPHYKIDRMTCHGPVSAPAWSLAARVSERRRTRTPGPGAHAPERCPAGRGPAYTLAARLQPRRLGAGPAPNHYYTRAALGGPAYTMAARLGFNVKNRSPGPAVYYQKDTDVYLTRPPLFSLGARLGERAAGRTPGPAAYPPQLYNFRKCPPAYSFGVKHAPWAPPLIIREDTMDCL